MTRRRLPPAEQMSPYFHEWLQWMATDTDLKPETIKSYNESVRRLVSWAEISPGTFGPHTFDHVLAADTARKMYHDVSKSTLQQSFSALNKFRDFCHERGLPTPYLGIDRLLRRLSPPRLVASRTSDPWSPDEIYSPSEIDELYGAAVHHGSQARGRVKPHRDLAILKFLAVVGLRPGELVAADVSWIQEGRGAEAGVLLEVRASRGRRIIRLSAEMVSVHKQWMDARKSLFGHCSPDDPLFVAETGERLTPSQLNSLIRSLSREAVVPYRPPKALRTAAWLALVEDGVPLHEIQTIMGQQQLPHLDGYDSSPVMIGFYSNRSGVCPYCGGRFRADGSCLC